MAKKPMPVTEELKQFLIEQYKHGAGERYLSKYIKCGDRHMIKLLEEWGVQIRKRRKFSLAETQDIIFRYVELLQSATTIGKRYKINPTTVVRILRRNGTPIRASRSIQRFIPNHNAFSEITPESAFFAGVLATDGNVSSRVPAVVLTSRDQDILNKFAAFIGLPYQRPKPRSTNRSVSDINFRSRQIVDDLARIYGIVPRKSLSLEIPNNNPDVVFNRFFWAGAICGDGHMGYSNGLPQIFLCSGSPRFIEQYVEFLKEHGFRSTNKIHHRPGRHYYKYLLCGSRAASLIRYLFTDLPVCMDRKYNMAQQILSDPRYSQ